jgi:pSer/pThr/pTyr-binding forkhead associated (FHA) protein
MLQSLEPLRARARTLGKALIEELGGPVLVARETIEGDLSFADPDQEDDRNPILRPGSTLLLDVRITPRERLTGPRRADRLALAEEKVVLLDAGKKTGVITVGRAPENDLVLKDPSVSSSHARLHPVPGTDWCFVVDLGSRNGTAHNDARLRRGQRAELQSGDEIAFGRQVFVFLHPRDAYSYLTGTL